ncbi:MAG: sugar phosphate isomerase/epimerase [Kiritimatiellaeota bacterium]|nr:sugar phosphate isomerase/epimerase [Kiritimatiellota bacterium]
MPKKTVIAAQLHTVRDFIKTPAETVKSLARLKKLGYDALEGAPSCVSPAEFRKMSLDAGLPPLASGTSIDELRKDYGKVVENCNELGVDHCMIAYLWTKPYVTPADWKKVAKEIDRFAERLAKDGIKLEYHNHMHEFEKVGVKNGTGGKMMLDYLFGDTQFLQAKLDFGWVVRGGQDPVAWAKRMKGRLGQVHIKDWGIVDNEPVWRAIGEGGIQWPEVFKACKASGTTCFIVEQDACPVSNDPFLSLAVSRKNIKAMGLG